MQTTHLKTTAHYTERVDAFLARASAARQTQEETLSRIVAALRDSRFGQEHRFDLIRCAADFRRQVPLQTPAQLQERIAQDASSLSPAPPLALLQTSATTGKPKRIPYTPAYREAIREAMGVLAASIFRDHPALPLTPGGAPRGLGLYQVSVPSGAHQGIPFDSFVSRLFDVAEPEDPFFHALPRGVYQPVDARERLYGLLLASAGWDLRGLRGTNPTTLLLFARVLSEFSEALIRDIADGAPSAFPSLRGALGPLLTPAPALARRLETLGRPLTPRDLWPNLEVLLTWRSGACGAYAPFLLERYGDVSIRGLLFAASEGVMGIPTDASMTGAVPAVGCGFFEFRPADSDGDDTLLLHELQQGQRYELILTSFSGLCRYLIGDLVEVDGEVRGCPVLRFLARKGKTCSMTGEKLTELQVEEAMRRVETALGVAPAFYLLSGQLAEVPYYVLTAEWPDPSRAAELTFRAAALLDAELVKENIEYAAKRDSQRLGPPVGQSVAQGGFERLYEAGASRGANLFKLPHLTAEPLHERLTQAAPR